MISSLKFVQGAVAKKDYQPAMTHFRIADGHVLGFNGEIAISCPIALDIEALPKATPFVRAIERCEDTATLHMTEAGKLSVRSGKFQAFVDCFDLKEEAVLKGITPEGEFMPVPPGFMIALAKLFPITGIDASRPWATGVLFRDESAYATNNIVLAQFWLGQRFPITMNVPRQAIAELLRINEDPTHMMVCERTATFFYEGDRWVRVQLYSTDWPDIDTLLGKVGSATFLPIPEGLFDALETVSPFVDDVGRVMFRGGRLATSLFDGEGASVEVEGLPTEGCYSAKHLALLKGIAEVIDLTVQPSPFRTKDGHVRGVVLGMRTA